MILFAKLSSVSSFSWAEMVFIVDFPSPPPGESTTNALWKLEVQTRAIVHVFKLQKWQNKNIGCHCATQNDFPIDNCIWKSRQINYPLTPPKICSLEKNLLYFGYSCKYMFTKCWSWFFGIRLQSLVNIPDRFYAFSFSLKILSQF